MEHVYSNKLRSPQFKIIVEKYWHSGDNFRGLSVMPTVLIPKYLTVLNSVHSNLTVPFVAGHLFLGLEPINKIAELFSTISLTHTNLGI